MRARNKEKGATAGQMDPRTMECGIRIKFPVKVRTSGRTAECTLEIGKIIACMVMESTLGSMADAMKVSTLTIKSTAKASMSGRTEGYMMEIGKMVSSTAMATTTIQLLVRLSAADGRTESAFVGTRIESY